MSAASFLVVVAIILYFVFYKPGKDMAAEASNKAAELAKYFGDVPLECYQIDGGKDQDIDALYVLFEGHRYSDPKNRYRVIETVYKADSERRKKSKREYVIKVLAALPYGHVPLYTSGFYADNFFERREQGLLMKAEDDLERSWEENKWKYEKYWNKQ